VKLEELRTKHYFLNYVPNQLISNLTLINDGRAKPDDLLKTIKKFKKLKLISPEILESELADVPQNEFIEKLDSFCS
jgi:hypothetical protein